MEGTEDTKRSGGGRKELHGAESITASEVPDFKVDEDLDELSDGGNEQKIDHDPHNEQHCPQTPLERLDESFSLPVFDE